MLTYSIAIRTLGTSGECLRRELLSIKAQTMQPEKVAIYIADGYSRPDFQIGDEEYIWVKKGMMAQRALRYDEITSDCVLTLDDDVELSPAFAETMLSAMEENNMDVLGTDIFKVHQMNIKTKIFAAVTNLVFPSPTGKYAFRIKSNGSFNYLNHPTGTTYLSQSCAGPAILWLRKTFNTIHLPDEMWMDELGFSYGDDELITYKAFINGYKLGVCFNASIKNLNAQTSSLAYRKSHDRFYVRSKAMFVTWWRMLYKPHGNNHPGNKKALIFGSLKFIWLTIIMAVAAIYLRNAYVFTSHLKGLSDGKEFVKSERYSKLSPYILG